MSIAFTTNLLSSDTLVACLVPLFVLILTYRISPPLRWADIRDILLLKSANLDDSRHHGHFSVQRAHSAYRSYVTISDREASTMKASFATLSRSSKRLAQQVGYGTKVDMLREVTKANGLVTNGIAALARLEFPEELDVENDASSSFGDVGGVEVGRVREALKHFVRDWSLDGKMEREKIYAPILELLNLIPRHERSEQKVLVPGAGLGRLAWEISELGFNTTANELSFYMNLGLRFLLSPTTTSTTNQHSVHPYSHWFSHQRANSSTFRQIYFPDVLPRLTSNFHLEERDFLKLTRPGPSSSSPVSNSNFWSKTNQPNVDNHGYDFIVTLFFIDTSLDVITTIQHIHTLLRPGGTWINLGPLLWTSGGQAKVEMSLEEVLAVAEAIGFVFDKQELGNCRTVECEYTGDPNAMMRWVYKAEFWVARKAPVDL